MLAPVSLWGGLAALFCIFGPFEHLIVTQIAFVNAAAPPRHAGLFNAVFWQLFYIGRTIGALLGPLLWEAVDTRASARVLSNGVNQTDAPAAGDGGTNFVEGSTYGGRVQPFFSIAGVCLVPVSTFFFSSVKCMTQFLTNLIMFLY